VSFAATTLFVASQRLFVVVVYFVIDSVRKLLDTRSYEVGVWHCITLLCRIRVGLLSLFHVLFSNWILPHAAFHRF
jgi:hypothetical protein